MGWICASFLIGSVIGFMSAAWMQVWCDKQSVERRTIKLCGKIYLLTEVVVKTNE